MNEEELNALKEQLLQAVKAEIGDEAVVTGEVINRVEAVTQQILADNPGSRLRLRTKLTNVEDGIEVKIQVDK